jgi:hypothetical protein
MSLQRGAFAQLTLAPYKLKRVQAQALRWRYGWAWRSSERPWFGQVENALSDRKSVASGVFPAAIHNQPGFLPLPRSGIVSGFA